MASTRSKANAEKNTTAELRGMHQCVRASVYVRVCARLCVRVWMPVSVF